MSYVYVIYGFNLVNPILLTNHNKDLKDLKKMES